MIEMKVSFDEDRKRALEDTRHWAALALSAEEKQSVDDPVEMERLDDEDLSPFVGGDFLRGNHIADDATNQHAVKCRVQCLNLKE